MTTNGIEPDGYTMLDRPWSAEEQARVDATVPPERPWRPGDISVSIWADDMKRYEDWLADEEDGHPIELALYEVTRREAELLDLEDPPDVRARREFSRKYRWDGIPLREHRPGLLTKMLPADGSVLGWADGGAGKSTFGTAVSLSLATGMELLPGMTPTVPPMRVLFLDYEGRTDINRRRLANMYSDEVPNLFYHLPEHPLTTPPGMREVEHLTREMGIDYMVLDSVGWAVNSDLSDPATPKALKDALQRLAIPSLCLFHVPKVSDLASPYGSVFWKNAFVEGWSMERIEDEPGHVFVMRSRKETEGEPGRVLAFRVNWGGWDDEGEPIADITFNSLDPAPYVMRGPGNPNLVAQNKARSRQDEYREAVVMACPALGKTYTKKDVGLAVSNMARMRGKPPPHRNTLMTTYLQLELEGVIEMPTSRSIRRMRDLDVHDVFDEPDLGL